jgi:hypothetical protein
MKNSEFLTFMAPNKYSCFLTSAIVDCLLVIGIMFIVSAADVKFLLKVVDNIEQLK